MLVLAYANSIKNHHINLMNAIWIFFLNKPNTYMKNSKIFTTHTRHTHTHTHLDPLDKMLVGWWSPASHCRRQSLLAIERTFVWWDEGFHLKAHYSHKESEWRSHVFIHTHNYSFNNLVLYNMIFLENETIWLNYIWI